MQSLRLTDFRTASVQSIAGRIILFAAPLMFAEPSRGGALHRP